MELQELCTSFANGSVSKAEVVQLVNETIQCDYFDEGWDEFDIVFQRAVWLFPDQVLLTLCPRSGAYLSHLTDALTEKSDLANALNVDAQWVAHANGFRMPSDLTPSALVDLLDQLSVSHGEPTLHLPWASIIEKLVDEMAEGEYDDDDDSGDIRIIVEFFASLAEDGIPETLPWKVSVDEADGYLPQYSDHGRFYDFLRILEDDEQWIVINSECCGTCASGSIQGRREESGFEKAPAFVVYEQNAETKWSADGWVSHLIYQEPEEMVVIRRAAIEAGLSVTSAGDDNLFVIGSASEVDSA